MSEKFKITEDEINQTLMHSPLALPDSPSQKGLGARQIKKYFYDFIRQLSQKVNIHLGDIGTELDGICESIFLAGESATEAGTRAQSAIDFTNEKMAEAERKFATNLSLGEVKARADEAFNLASGKAKIHVYKAFDEVFPSLASANAKVGDLIIVADKYAPDLIVADNSLFQTGDFNPRYENGELVGEAPLPKVGFVYRVTIIENGKESVYTLIGVESGVDASEIVSHSDLVGACQSYSGKALEDAKAYADSLAGNLATKKELKNYAGDIDYLGKLINTSYATKEELTNAVLGRTRVHVTTFFDNVWGELVHVDSNEGDIFISLDKNSPDLIVVNNTYNHLADYRFTFDEILNGYEPEVKVGAMYNLTYDYNGHVGEKTVVAIESGIDTSAFATKEELEGYALKEKWEKIEELTVEPDFDGALPSSILFTLDKNGNPFKLTKLKAIVETDSLEENGGAYASATLSLNVAQQQDSATTRALYITGLPTTVNKYSRAIFDAYVLQTERYMFKVQRDL